ncbi:MIND complex subunit NNF1 KNAG_0D01250 [Huiozyma naganishii CBS 8797]|uniref:Kinetochore-associated protein n=1 Tax=Huiozyma naganishii (strain ATCC MYA-139 / BCRC 22969 / CBS 8797 / KCTC 17520 / NBRC 10181 / NCYC 3082 / Yp74L-3) TaxID=1071383 RepID=J7RXP8_HUIN7|nr:hypothetical protein KNAG_0D01250 [Kazachstania naganishii CBS 8797]CCK69877.1 hypothetical protein KNAG_0D01250 [Kazachstania naganishii CBS 8797]
MDSGVKKPVPKIRYVRLNQVFNKALKQSLVKFQNIDKLSSCFPQFSKTAQGRTRLLNSQKQVSTFWEELGQREFNEILKEHNAEAKLNELDQLISEARERLNKKKSSQDRDTDSIEPEISIGSLTAQELLECNLYSQRKKAIRQIDKKLERIKTMNDSLESEMKQLQEEMERDSSEIRTTMKRFLGDRIRENPNPELRQSLDDMIREEKDYFP